MLIKKSKIKIIRCLIALMDICFYIHVNVNKIIRCEYNNGGARVKLDKLGGGACPKSLKTPVLEYESIPSQNVHDKTKTIKIWSRDGVQVSNTQHSPRT